MICILLPWQQGEKNCKTQRGPLGTPEMQSTSMSLRNEMVMVPESFDKKHFAATFEVLALISCVLVNADCTVSIWHLGMACTSVTQRWPPFLFSFYGLILHEKVFHFNRFLKKEIFSKQNIIKQKLLFERSPNPVLCSLGIRNGYSPIYKLRQ